jgi:hypothetical protein
MTPNRRLPLFTSSREGVFSETGCSDYAEACKTIRLPLQPVTKPQIGGCVADSQLNLLPEIPQEHLEALHDEGFEAFLGARDR